MAIEKIDISQQQRLALKKEQVLPTTVETNRGLRGLLQSFSHVRVREESNTDAPTKLQIAIWGALLLIGTLLSLQAFQTFQLGVYKDDSVYAILAKSLAQSGVYGLINSPGQPAQSAFPFGYPLLLAPLAFWFPNNLDALKVPSLLATLLNATLIFWGWRYFSRQKSHWWGLAVAGLYLFSPLTISHTRMVMSEPVFTTFCLLAIFLAEQAAHRTPGRGWSLLMSLALISVIFTRSVGIVLAASIFAYLLIVKRKTIWKQLALVILETVVFISMVVTVSPIEAEDLLPLRYLNSLANRPSTVQPTASLAPSTDVLIPNWRLQMNQDHLIGDIPGIILPSQGEIVKSLAGRISLPSLPIVLGLFVDGLIALGFLRWLIVDGPSLIRLFPILYLGALLVWIWDDPRLLYPIQPPVQFGFLLGVETLLIPLRSYQIRTVSFRNWGTLILVVIAVALISISVRQSLRIDDTRVHVGDLPDRTSWLKANTNVSDIIMTEQPVTDFLYGGRKTVPYPESGSSPRDLENYLANNNVTYILVAPVVAWQLHYTPLYSRATKKILPLIESLTSDNRLTLVYSSQSDLIRVLKIGP